MLLPLLVGNGSTLIVVATLRTGRRQRPVATVSLLRRRWLHGGGGLRRDDVMRVRRDNYLGNFSIFLVEIVLISLEHHYNYS